MVSIYVDGHDKTQQISDWTIYWNDDDKALCLTCHFPSKKRFTRPLSACRVEPSREVGASLLTKPGSVVATPVEKVSIYGERYAVVHYPGSARPYVHKMDGIGFAAQTAMKEGPVFRYFMSVANARVANAASADQQKIATNVVYQLDKLPAHADTALHAYCTGANGIRAPAGGLIYPFGVNESQLMAVERAFGAQVSVIEGPPGTGKTQTILNILANILLRGRTVAVLSNNNAAVENVYEKLEKSGLGHLVAKLGSKQNREGFFAQLPAMPTATPEPAPAMAHIQDVLAQLKEHLHSHNRAATLRAEIDELRIERRYLQQWQEETGTRPAVSLEKYELSPHKTTDLMAYLSHLGEQRIGLRDRIELMLNFRIWRTRPFADAHARLSFFHALQMHYYDTVLREKEAALLACEASLARGNFTALLAALTKGSMQLLTHHLHEHVHDAQVFEEKTYKRHFDAFVRRFPILCSSTHSIVNSIAAGAMLDYVILDEASQQDIVPGILALGCAKNVIIVGDRQQLAHIAVTLGLPARAEAYDCERYSLLDSCIGVFKNTLPSTLLKEHYRCHPRIIQFCNQQFYGNALIPMTQDKGESPLRLVVTAKGNHARSNTNLRELDSLLKVLEAEDKGAWLGADGRGFIAPFRAQATLAEAHLPADFLNETVHKFQGRECDEIVFSTVLDKKRSNQDRLAFVDDARMVNVAVSRAKHTFTLVTGDEVFTANNGHIAALIRYIEYYADEKQVLRAPVVSAFDLLYQEYDQSLARLHARLPSDGKDFQSERIVAQLLREALPNALMCHGQVRLNQIAESKNPALTPPERAFLAQGASCDFVLYFKVGKKPLGVIEVDGDTHLRPDRMTRDALKNSILAKSDIPILRLRTVESHIEDKIAGFIATWTDKAPSEWGKPADDRRLPSQ